VTMMRANGADGAAKIACMYDNGGYCGWYFGEVVVEKLVVDYFVASYWDFGNRSRCMTHC
jgi:hypothetical protein